MPILDEDGGAAAVVGVRAAHGLAEHSRLGRSLLDRGMRFGDLFSAMFQPGEEDEDEEA